MAKRRRKKENQSDLVEQRRALLLKIGWAIVLVVSILFGVSYGYPIAAEGDVMQGILVGLAYGGSALGAILISFYLNRKLRGH